MTMILDTVITVAIGRNDASGRPLKGSTWSRFQREVRELLASSGTVVAHVAGADGVGSDGVNDGQAEETALFIVVNPKNELGVRRALSSILGRYGQYSAAFAVDHYHEPCFAGTTDGFRPRVAVDDFLADGRTRRTQSHG